jgi:hypothetical protein
MSTTNAPDLTATTTRPDVHRARLVLMARAVMEVSA